MHKGAFRFKTSWYWDTNLEMGRSCLIFSARLVPEKQQRNEPKLPYYLFNGPKISGEKLKSSRKLPEIL